MRSETRLKSFFFCVGPYLKFALAMVLCAGGVVLADWDVGDPALYYQLPDDSDGWSVYGDGGGAEPVMVADDWTAAVTTTITDIYFWGGWRGDAIGSMGDIYIQIFSNDTSGLFARPGESVWSRVIAQGQYTVRQYQEQWQGFYDPRQDGEWSADDHEHLFQYSIPVITDPFTAKAGQTYWLMISATVEGPEWGWNTAGSVSGGSAVFWDENNAQWAQLMTPQDPLIPLDMAYVLTPEPATLLLFGLGAAIVRKRKI